VIDVLLIWLGERGLGPIRLVGLIVCGLALIWLALPPLLHDVLEIWRSDGAACERDSNCASQSCHHPELAPTRSYCSHDCKADGHCTDGMRCVDTGAGWACVKTPRQAYGTLCGEDSDCASERCALMFTQQQQWKQSPDTSAADFQAGFCVNSCSQDASSCPAADPCVALRANTSPVCIPKRQIEAAAFNASTASHSAP
jgi:hypothetical protein